MSFSMLKSEISSQNYQNGLTSNSILPKLYLLKHFVGKVFIQHTLFVLTYLLVNLVSCPRVMQQYLSQRLDSALHYRVGKIFSGSWCLCIIHDLACIYNTTARA